MNVQVDVQRHWRDRKTHWLQALRGQSSLPKPILTAGLSSFFAFISFFLLVAAFPLYLAQTLAFSPSEVGIVIGFTYILNSLAYVVVGQAGDRSGGAARYITWSALALAPAALLFGVFRNVWLLASVGLWQGLTMSAYSVASVAFAGQIADEKRRGAIVGIYGMFSNAAMGIAPPLGVLVLKTLGLPTLLLSSFGAALLAALLGLPLFGKGGRVAPAHREPLWTWLAEGKILLLPLGAVVAQGIVYGVLLAFMPGYLASRGVLNPGLFYSARLAATLALRAIAGAFSDRYGRPMVAGSGLFLIGVGTLALYRVSTNGGTIITGLVIGIGWSLFQPVILAWLFDVTSRDRRGLASAAYFIALDIGRVIGTIGMGYATIIGGATTPFTVAGVSAGALGLVLMLLISHATLQKGGQRHVS